MIFKSEEIEGIKERENYNPKLAMRLPHCFEYIQDSYPSDYKGLMDLLNALISIIHRTEMEEILRN